MQVLDGLGRHGSPKYWRVEHEREGEGGSWPGSGAMCQLEAGVGRQREGEAITERKQARQTGIERARIGPDGRTGRMRRFAGRANERAWGRPILEARRTGSGKARYFLARVRTEYSTVPNLTGWRQASYLEGTRDQRVLWYLAGRCVPTCTGAQYLGRVTEVRYLGYVPRSGMFL